MARTPQPFSWQLIVRDRPLVFTEGLFQTKGSFLNKSIGVTTENYDCKMYVESVTGWKDSHF